MRKLSDGEKLEIAVSLLGEQGFYAYVEECRHQEQEEPAPFGMTPLVDKNEGEIE